MQPANIVRVNELKEHTLLAEIGTHWESVMLKPSNAVQEELCTRRKYTYYCEHTYFQRIHIMPVNYFLPDIEE